MMTVHSTLAFEEFLINVVRNPWNFVYILRDKVVCCHFELLYSARMYRRKEQYFVSGVHNLNCLKTITLFHDVNHRISPTRI